MQNHIKDAESVIRAEKDHINTDRKDSGKSQPPDYTGLALSGGGIRSASFCLGIIQALVAGGTLKKMDYLSTASGGGYIGASLSWFLHRGLPDGTPAGTEPKNFPFGKAGCGARTPESTSKPNAILDYIRQHGRYLTPGNGLDFIAFAGYVLRTSIVSFLVYFSVFTLALLVVLSLRFLFTPTPVPDFSHGFGALLVIPNVFLLAAIIFCAFFVITGIFYSVVTRISLGSTTWRYTFRVYNQITLSLFLKLAFVSLIFGSLPVVYDYLLDFGLQTEVAGSSTVLGTLMGWYQHYKQQRSTQKEQEPKGSDTRSIIASALIIYGLLLGAFILATNIDQLSTPGFEYSLAALLGIVIFVGLLTNINYASAHRMYRDRLMEAFMPDMVCINDNQWGLAKDADKSLIEDMCQSPNRRPYHLINTNLVLANSPTSKYRGRGGDSFIISPLFCGSDATGWRKSVDFMKSGSRGMTLATAMAISGASLNPNAGNSGRGLSRNRWVSVLYTLLNFRLGYWAINPNSKGSRWISPNFINPGLTQSILGDGLNENSKTVELSDGGHFDNLALYELIRRKVKTVIACDGGADEKFTFDDLGNAIERVRVDFGAKIAFDDPDFDLRWVVPGSADDSSSEYKPAKRGFAIANITYSDKSKGVLIYIKSTLTAHLPTDLYSYKAANPSYPHQPTVDQFFDEVQFESYRELGYYLGWQMLEANANVKPNEDTSTATQPRWI